LLEGLPGSCTRGTSSPTLQTRTGAPPAARTGGLADQDDCGGHAQGNEFTHEGRTFRSTEVVQHTLFGVDYCSTDGRGDYACVITLNTGAFLRE